MEPLDVVGDYLNKSTIRYLPLDLAEGARAVAIEALIALEARLSAAENALNQIASKPYRAEEVVARWRAASSGDQE